MFKIKVNKNIVSVQETELMTAGSASVYRCKFDFDDMWTGFFRSAVFRVDSKIYTVPLDNNDECVIPWELTAKKNTGLTIEVSVYGNRNEGEVITATWDSIGRVRTGSELGESSKPPTPNAYDRFANLVREYSDKVDDDVERAKTYAGEAKEWAEKAEQAVVGNLSVTADKVTFTDGETFQQKYNSGELTGPAGPAGKDGVQGPAGAPGYTPVKGVDYFDGQPGYTPVKGVDYFDGQPGYTPVKGVDYFDGEPGKDGITPHIGVNKNWFIGDTDTGIKAEGKDGQDGVDGSGGGSALDVYSTEETVVGTWIDGKPLYRKVLMGTVPTVSTNGTFVWTALKINGSMDTLLPVQANVYNPSSTQYLMLPYHTGDNTGQMKVISSKSASTVSIGSNQTQWNGWAMTMIVMYTKTTDTAANGISTTALMDAYEEGVNEA